MVQEIWRQQKLQLQQKLGKQTSMDVLCSLPF